MKRTLLVLLGIAVVATALCSAVFYQVVKNEVAIQLGAKQ